MAENVFDAIVLGSGNSRGWAAKELCEKGLKVIMLEQGKNVEHIQDYKSAKKAPWKFPHRRRLTQQMTENYPILKWDNPNSYLLLRALQIKVSSVLPFYSCEEIIQHICVIHPYPKV